MSFIDFFVRLFPGRGHGVEELARRLGMSPEELQGVQPAYEEFAIPKRAGGTRRILAPAPKLKDVQRRILCRLLNRLRCHPAATGFQRGQSIVSNARPHVGKAVVVRMDLKNFFESTRTSKIRAYFRHIGWNRPATRLLLRLCTWNGGLPQGAPTSPRLSNLVNYRLDARLAGMAAHPANLRFRNPFTGEMLAEVAFPPDLQIKYTRYADDLTFSFSSDHPVGIRALIGFVKWVVRAHGYALHHRKKLQIRRQHARQLVTGLVVNERVRLPRETRRWLRAVEHHAANGKSTTLSPLQLEGWRALQGMIARQGERGRG